jgi:SnoaL-like domain
MKASATLAPHPFTVDEAVARSALSHLVAAYGHGIDRRDYALVASLYHPDAIDDHSPYFCGPAADYVAWLPSMMRNWSATSHVMLSSLFIMEGDHAQGEISARAWHLTADGKREFIAWGRYADHYERREGVWKFLKRSFILDHVEDVPVREDDDFGTGGVDRGQAGAHDPCYTRLPWFMRDRDNRASGPA